MRQTSRFKYERVHHDSNTSTSVSPTTADLLAPVAPRAASTHGQPTPLSRLQLACRICNRAETCPQASPDVPAGTDAGGSRHPPGAPSAAGSDASNGRMSTDAAADADVDAEGWGGGTCFVCLDAAADAVLVQCGHGGLCAGAAAPRATRTTAIRMLQPALQKNLQSDDPGAMWSSALTAAALAASDVIDRAAAAESRLRRLDLRQAERGGSLPAVPAMGGVGGADRQAGGPAGAGRAGAVDARALSCTDQRRAQPHVGGFPSNRRTRIEDTPHSSPGEFFVSSSG